MSVKSDIELPQLVGACEVREPDVLINEGLIPQDILEDESVSGKKYTFSDKKSWLSNKTCRLFVENGQKITYALKDGGSREYLKSYILGFGMAMLAMQRGSLAIHCSAVADDKGAVLIAGESGSGKSTLTSALLGEKGYRLMADDMAFVEVCGDRAYAKPAFPYQKLCRNVAIEQGYDLDRLIYINEEKDKFLVPYKGEFMTEAVPIKGFIYLNVGDVGEIKSDRVDGLNKFYLCAENLFLRHLLKNDKYEPAIGKKCLEAASKIPMYCITRPNGIDTSRQVIETAFEICSYWDM